MNTRAHQTQENKSQSVAAASPQQQSDGESLFQFVDNRPETIAKRKLQEITNNRPQMKQLMAFQEMANNSLQAKQAAQLHTRADNHSAKQQHPTQKKENNTSLPGNLKTGMEHLSGMSLDDVKVHYNSDKPTQLQAHAYAQGTDIHLGSGQEKHLPHEAWHVVQQKQGRVKPTRQRKVNINDNAGLEKEADVMGEEAFQMGNSHEGTIVPQKKTENTAQLISSHLSSQVVQRVIEKGLPKGTKVRVTSGQKKGETGVIQSEIGGCYKVLLTGRRLANQIEYRDLEVDNSSEEQAITETEDKPDKTTKEKEAPDDKITPTIEDKTQETTEDTTEGRAKDTIIDKTEETTSETTEQVVPQVLSTLAGHINDVVQKDDWNNADLVEEIGKASWNDIKAAWDAINHVNKAKLTLVKLRGKPYDETDDDLISYEGWSDNFMGKQSGNKWGTETEGGGITLSLKSAYQSKDKEAKEKLKAALGYFKRTALMETDTHTLALDNVNDKIDALLDGKQVSMPIEVASKPMSGSPDEKDKANLLKEEKRTLDNWPTLKKSGTSLAVKKGRPKAIDKFNDFFVTHGVNNIMLTQKPQHVTKSGQVEDRLDMANELKSTVESLDLGTRGKSGLSGKAKTSLEFLRHSSLNQEQVKAMEKAGHQMRTSLRTKFKEQKGADIKFADEELNGIIVPVTGVPREIGAYTLATPMTNVFPLLDKGGGKVTTLREYR